MTATSITICRIPFPLFRKWKSFVAVIGGSEPFHQLLQRLQKNDQVDGLRMTRTLPTVYITKHMMP